MPNQPYLDYNNTKVDGLAFIGLSLTRRCVCVSDNNNNKGHPDTITHQEAFDLNEVIDREYEYLMSTNDDGWLVGGGEPGPPRSYKLASKDSSHVEIMRIGTYNPEWGGISMEELVEALESGNILIPQMEVVPTSVIANDDVPPELEVRFDMEPCAFDKLLDVETPLPDNWCLRFVHNQLFHYFKFPSRFCPGPFHSTIVRKADFRSDDHRKRYFEMCNQAILRWRKQGPKPLNTKWNVDGSTIENPPQCFSGVWLFQDRLNISHHFAPNFLPPYNTREKRGAIAEMLKNEWDDKELLWKHANTVPSWAPASTPLD